MVCDLLKSVLSPAKPRPGYERRCQDIKCEMVCVCGAPIQLRLVPAASRPLVRCHSGRVASQIQISGHRGNILLCVQLPFEFFEHFACASRHVRSGNMFIDGYLCSLRPSVPNVPEQKSMKTSLDMHSEQEAVWWVFHIAHKKCKFSTPSSYMYVASAVFEDNLITTRSIDSCVLLTWAAADSWQSLLSVKAHCSAFQTHCSCGPCTANHATAALWLSRCGAPAACVFECGPTREEGLQTELWRKKPGKRIAEVSMTRKFGFLLLRKRRARETKRGLVKPGRTWWK